MKFRCERDVLFEALSTTSRAVSAQRAGFPALTGIHISAKGSGIEVTGTDLDLTMRMSCAAVVSSEGVCVVPARLVVDIVKSMGSGAVTFESEENEVRISAGKAQFSVRTYESEEFPSVNVSDSTSAQLDGSEFIDALRQVVRAASSDDTRPVLTGILLSAEESGLRLVATDSYRLAVRDVPGSSAITSDQPVLVPSKALGELMRLSPGEEKIAVGLGEREIHFQAGNVQLISRLIEGQFPQYRPLIPDKYPNHLRIDRDLLLEAVRRVRLVVRDTTTPVRMAFRADGVELTVVSQEIGQAMEEVEAKYEGEPMTVAFNPAYLIDGLEVSASGDVVIETIDALKPATITSEDNKEFLYLIMPVRVS